MFFKKKFGREDAARALAFAKSRGKQVNPEVVFGLGMAVAALGLQNVAAQEARADAQRLGKAAADAYRAAGAAETVGISKAESFRMACDNFVKSIHDFAERMVTKVTNHYRAAAARAEARAEVLAKEFRASAKKAEKARAEAAEIADLF